MDILLKYNFAENYSRIKSLQQEPKETSLIAGMKSQLRIEVATRNSSVQLIPGHDTTKTSLEGEMEGCIKSSRDRKVRLYQKYQSTQQ